MTKVREMIVTGTTITITPRSTVVVVAVGVNKVVAMGIGVAANDTSMTVN